MAAGDILFYSGNAFYEKVIQWQTHGPFNHVCVDIGNNQVIEAKWPTVSLDVRGTPTKSFSTNYDPAKLASAIAWLRTTVGDKYDLLDIAANVFTFILPNTRIVRTPTMFICSELAAYFLRAAGYPFPANFLPDGKSMALVTPNSLARTLGMLV